MADILDIEVSGFSCTDSSGDEEKNTKRLDKGDKNLVRIIVTDGLIGLDCNDKRVKYFAKEGGNFKQVAKLALDYMDSLPSAMKPHVLISAGNYDLMPDKMGLKPTLNTTQLEEVKDRVKQQISREIVILAELINEAGGKLAVASLLPCPKTQCPNSGNLKKYPEISKIISDLYVEMNDKIYSINKKFKSSFSNLKSGLEVSRKPIQLYVGRRQKKIELQKFNGDKITPCPNYQSKLRKMAINTLIYLHKTKDGKKRALRNR